MESIPSMDDLLDELEDDVRKSTNAPENIRQPSGFLFDRGPSLPCSKLPPTRELVEIPFKLTGNNEEIKVTVQTESVSSTVPQPHLPSPTPSDVVDMHYDDEGTVEYPEEVTVEPKEEIQPVPETKVKVKLFAGFLPPVPVRSNIDTADTEFQEVLAYLDKFEEQSKEADDNHLNANVEIPEIVEKESGQAESSQDAELAALDVTTASDIHPSDMEKFVGDSSGAGVLDELDVNTAVSGTFVTETEDEDSTRTELPEMISGCATEENCAGVNATTVPVTAIVPPAITVTTTVPSVNPDEIHPVDHTATVSVSPVLIASNGSIDEKCEATVSSPVERARVSTELESQEPEESRIDEGTVTLPVTVCEENVVEPTVVQSCSQPTVDSQPIPLVKNTEDTIVSQPDTVDTVDLEKNEETTVVCSDAQEKEEAIHTVAEAMSRSICEAAVMMSISDNNSDDLYVDGVVEENGASVGNGAQVEKSTVNGNAAPDQSSTVDGTGAPEQSGTVDGNDASEKNGTVDGNGAPEQSGTVDGNGAPEKNGTVDQRPGNCKVNGVGTHGELVMVKERSKKKKQREKEETVPEVEKSTVPEIREIDPVKEEKPTITDEPDKPLEEVRDFAPEEPASGSKQETKPTQEDSRREIGESSQERNENGYGIKDEQMDSATTSKASIVKLLDEEAGEVEREVAGRDADEQTKEGEAENAIEVAASGSIDEDTNDIIRVVDTEVVEGPRGRFQDEVIATVHDMAEEHDPHRLTESELQLGKTKPYWIPDEDCSECMLCSLKFSLLNRRHHCRACGRVLCANCCKEKATLVYLGEDEKKNKARVCHPCFSMLERIVEHDTALLAAASASSASGTAHGVAVRPTPARGVLKTRTVSECEEDASASPSQSHSQGTSQSGGIEERKRSVMFRDGLRPGDAMATSSEDRAGSTRAQKKKSPRKRVHVARRLASLKVEEEMGSVLPTEDGESVVIRERDGTVRVSSREEVDARLCDNLPVDVLIKKNLSCVVQLCQHPLHTDRQIWCVSSRGFSAVGIDEVVFLWDAPPTPARSLPITVLERVAEMMESCLDSDHLGIRRVSDRLPTLHSCHAASPPPFTRHVLLFRPNTKITVGLCVPWPSTPFVIACFVLDTEMTWALASPNRLLLRLGLLASWYPTPLINDLSRSPVYTNETSQTVLKVFTDFRNWNYRLQHLHGSTVALSNQETTIQIPKSALREMKTILEWNRSMIAWSCDINDDADSHLVCVEEGGGYCTRVLAQGGQRNVTGTCFIIFDGGLKTVGEKVQVTVVEDGVTVRMSADQLTTLVEALSNGQDWSLSSPSSSVHIKWLATPTPAFSQLVSPIDGLYLGDKFQYGLSLSRVITTALQVSSCPEHAIRLSHVFNMDTGRLQSEDEAKIFSVAEMLSRESTAALDPYMQMLIAMNVNLIALRFHVSPQAVEYEVSPWIGLEEDQMTYRQSLDQLVPVLVNILNYLPNGFHLEIHLSIVSAKDLPVVSQS